MQNSSSETGSGPVTKRNGPVAAAFLAAGIGALVLGLFVVINEAIGTNNGWLKFDSNFGLGSGVGPLSGKVAFEVIAYLVSWGTLSYLWRRREVDFGRVLSISLVLVAIGFLLTFPPVFEIFAAS
jgi:hypothetical protein